MSSVSLWLTYVVARADRFPQPRGHVRHDVSHCGQGGDVPGHAGRVDPVDRVGLGVVDDEVLRRVHFGRHRGDAGRRDAGPDVGAAAGRTDVRRANGPQQRGDGGHLRACRVVAAEAEAGGRCHAQVRFNHQHVPVKRGLMPRPVVESAAQAVFFIGVEHDPHGPSRTKVQLLQQTGRFPRGDASAGVVAGAGAHIPRVEVARHDDDLVGSLASAQLGDDVGRIGVRLEMRLHLQAHAKTLAAGCLARESLRVFSRDRRRRNLRHARAVDEHAGVWRPQAVGAERAHQHRDRAVLCGLRRAVGAVRDGLPVAAVRRVEQHDAPTSLGAAALELGEAADDEQVRLDALAWSAGTQAKAEHRDAVRARGDQVEGLGAADPLRDLHRIGPHLVEPVRLHRRDRPRDGVFERLRAAEAMAKGVGQKGQAIPRELIGCRRGNDARDWLAIRIDERRGLRPKRRRAQNNRDEHDQPTHPHATEHT